LADPQQRAPQTDASADVHIDRIGKAFAGHAARRLAQILCHVTSPSVVPDTFIAAAKAGVQWVRLEQSSSIPRRAFRGAFTNEHASAISASTEWLERSVREVSYREAS
jgi:hypothetical protein